MAELRRYLIEQGVGLLRSFRLLACAGFLGLAGSASSAFAVEPEVTGPMFTVLATGTQSLPEGLHYLTSPNEGVPFEASSARRTAPMAAPAGTALVFGVPRPAPAEGESRFMPLFSANWPAGATERVLVLLAAEGDRLGGVAIDDGERVFPRGTLRVVNLLGRPIAARWGDFTGEFAPGPGPAHPYPATQTNPNGPPARFRVMLGAIRPDRSGTDLIYAGRAEARPGARTLVVIREVRERAVNDDDEIVDAGISYSTRWVVDSLPVPAAP